MSDISNAILKLDIAVDLFKNVKFFVSGEVHEKILDLLKNGGAERINYFSDYVTHLIVGENPEENDITDAIDVYEIPALIPKWVLICTGLKRLVDTKPYLHIPGGKLFTNLVFCFSSIREDLNFLWALVTFNGGIVQLNLNSNCDYLVTTSTESAKYEKAESLGSELIKIVTPDWVVQAVKNKSILDHVIFHPKLIDWPKPVKHESTTAITGFEPEHVLEEEEIGEKVGSETQDLLAKLKQRMPWNQPVTSTMISSSDPVGPPNVVAPSYVSSQLSNQHSRLQPPQSTTSHFQQQQQQVAPQPSTQSNFTSPVQSNQKIPKTVVHHTPNQQTNFQQQANPSNINRLVGQPQVRSNLQLCGQIEQSQLHQQLIQQNQGNVIQRPPNQQQFLQQQMAQRQRQLLQNQINQNQLMQQQQQQQQQPQGGTQPQILQDQQHITSNNHLGQMSQQQLSQLQQQIQLKQNQQMQLSQNQHQLQMNQGSQIQMNQNQQIQMTQNQQQQNQTNQNAQLHIQNQQLIQIGQNQQPISVAQNKLQLQSNQSQQIIQMNQGQQVQANQNQQHIPHSQNQQVQQTQQIHLNQNQHIQLQNQQVQNQPQILQNQVVQAANQQPSQSPQHIQMNQGQTFLPQNMNQHLISQANTQISQQKSQYLNQQQAVSSHQQIHNQPNLTVQQQFVPSFSQNDDSNQRNINQQNLNQQGVNPQNLNVHALNQQLSTQNLGQQLNQQQLNQQLNQQTQMNQQVGAQTQNSQLAQQLNQGGQLDQLSMGQLNLQMNQLNQNQLNQQNQVNQQNQLTQQITSQNQLTQQITSQNQLTQQITSQNQLTQQITSQNQLTQQSQLNQQTLDQGLGQGLQALNQQLNQGINQLQQQQINRQSIQQQLQLQQQQGLNQQNLQQLNQMNQQVNQNLPQQIVRTQFQQQGNMGQQILINQPSPQNQTAPRQQLNNQHLWSQQQSPQIPGQQIIRHPVNVIQQGSPRVQWSPNAQQGNAAPPQRQFIQLDARTHQELQKMPPEQQAIFVAKIQRHRQFLKQVQQQRQGGGSHILIRGNVPPGLTTQQQFQWLQQQAKQQGIVLPPNIQQQNITPGTLIQPGLAPGIQQAPGLSPINQNNAPQFAEQVQIRQFKLQHLQLQREQAQKNHLAQQQQGAIPQPTIVRPIGQPQLADSTTNSTQGPDANIQHSLVVNSKTKTALANMLNIKLQSGGSSVGGPRPEAITEPSAAGTLRLMTAQHNAAINSKPQEIIALQRRTIPGPNGDIMKHQGVPQLPLTPSNEPPKLQYCPKPSLPLQHRPGPFYGHNPNLKLPPELFLLGCIFVVVEVDDFLEETIPGWQQKIEKHGGEVEKQYCSRVTHVLCETQRHGVVMQALRDCKRCVTILWLNDVITRKQVLPPWTALHLPSIYLDTAPAAKHLISISGFEGNDRWRVKEMVKHTGGKCTSYFSKHNTLLISSKGDGKKVSYAKKWQIPVVNVQWLTDVMLGHFAAMNQMDHQMYQQFQNPANFSFDPKLVPNLMVAWKAPINISQESYERVKRCASPVVLPKMPKKQKVETTDENDNISDERITNSSYRIMFSMYSDTKELQRIVRDLGGSVVKGDQEFTHLVMPRMARTNKLFFAIAKATHIVSDRWLSASQEANQFVSEQNYPLDPKDFNCEYNCDMDRTFLTRNRNRLFEGKFFFITPSVFPSKKLVVDLIKCCGGIVEKHRRSSAQIEATAINSPFSYFIVTHEDDLHLVADLLRNKKDKMRIVCNAELIFSAILKQTFEVEPYAVCVL